MAYTRTFEGFAPPRRYDSLPYTEALIRESATEMGAYTTIDTKTLSPVDADPESPASHNFTTDDATLALGWYIIRWRAAAGDVFDSDPVYYPSFAPGAAYAEIADVQQQNVVRTLTATSRPNTGQVSDWLEQTAGVIDGLLRESGYTLPVPTTATQALKMLEHYNALGAAAMVEWGAPTSDRRKEAMDLWDNAQQMLREDLLNLDMPRDDVTHTVRSNFSSSPTPFFTRDLEL
jgi:hypothetical protein